ncbi:hypothetical protein [Streptomyces sp. SID13588]|nr:hypothetical protein [Streptomyces sp. SID13588]
MAIVRDLSRAMAMLDAILSPDWESRYYSFDTHWSPTEEMASMRDGSGNDYSVVFSSAGAYARGFDHESPMSPYKFSPMAPWPGLLDEVPEAFRTCLTDLAFSLPDGTHRATTCFWREHSDTEWKAGAVDFPQRAGGDADGANWLFSLLVDGRPEAYQQFAEDYYEAPVNLDTVCHFYNLRPMSQSIVTSLNAEVSLKELANDIIQIGYPMPPEPASTTICE